MESIRLMATYLLYRYPPAKADEKPKRVWGSHVKLEAACLTTEHQWVGARVLGTIPEPTLIQWNKIQVLTLPNSPILILRVVDPETTALMDTAAKNE
jgi:hypothetical protein